MTDFYRTQTRIDPSREHVFRIFVEPDLLPKWLGVARPPPTSTRW